MRTTLKEREEVLARLAKLGISGDDARDLRRIAMTLHRWAEDECNGAIERQGDDADGAPMRMWETQGGQRKGFKIPDRERGALKRLASIMARYPGLHSYHQGDPRGASLFILRDADVRGPVDSCYNNGVAVY